MIIIIIVFIVLFVIPAIVLVVWSQISRKDKVKKRDLPIKKYSNDKYLPLVCEYVEKGKKTTIPLKGISMRPFLENDRDEGVLVKRTKFKKGQVVLAEISKGVYVLHRIDRIVVNGVEVFDDCDNSDADVTLRGDGNVYGTESCKVKDIRALCCEVIRNGKLYDLESSKCWRFYSWYWTNTLCIRRYQLAIYKLLWRHELPDRWKMK